MKKSSEKTKKNFKKKKNIVNNFSFFKKKRCASVRVKLDNPKIIVFNKGKAQG